MDLKELDLEKIGERIRTARKQKHMSQTALGDALGVTYKTICNWEKGVTQIDVQSLATISKIFNLSTDYFLCLSDFTHPENEFIASELGISDESVNTLRNLEDSGAEVLDFMASTPEKFYDFIYYIDTILRNDNYVFEEKKEGEIAQIWPTDKKSTNITWHGDAEKRISKDSELLYIPAKMLRISAIIEIIVQLMHWRDEYNKDDSDD